MWVSSGRGLEHQGALLRPETVWRFLWSVEPPAQPSALAAHTPFTDASMLVGAVTHHKALPTAATELTYIQLARLLGPRHPHPPAPHLLENLPIDQVVALAYGNHSQAPAYVDPCIHVQSTRTPAVLALSCDYLSNRGMSCRKPCCCLCTRYPSILTPGTAPPHHRRTC